MFILSSLVDRRSNPLLRHVSRRAASMNDRDLQLTTELETSLEFISRTLDKDIRPMCHLQDPELPNHLIYTDASFSRGKGRGMIGQVALIDGKFEGYYMSVSKQEIHKSVAEWPINFLE